MKSRVGIGLCASVLAFAAFSSAATAKDGKTVSVVINGDGGPSADAAALKTSAATMLCLSYTGASTAKVTIKGQTGTKTVKCSKVRGGTTDEKVKTSDAEGTRKDPIPVGQATDVGDGWTIKVTNVVADAAGAVEAENQFNDPPPPGKTFFLVGIEGTYNGDEAKSQISMLQFSSVDAGNVSYGSQDYCGVIPGALGYDDVFQGGTVGGNVCWTVDAANTASLVMYVQTGFGNDPVFFALA